MTRLLRLILCIAALMPFAVFAQSDSTIIPLWKNGAPGFENRKDEPEKGGKYTYNVNNPTITVYMPPKDKANGAAIVVCPGGGHRILVFNSEGTEPAHFLTQLGFVVAVLKYRLARDTNSPYKLQVHAKQDAERAIRTVRSNAGKWGFDANRLGIMGFSAGGEVVDWVAFEKGDGDPKAADPIERESFKTNFAIMVYPGPLGVPEVVPPDSPPAFLVVADDDECCSPPVIKLLQKYREAGVSVEAHIFSKGNHAFNMGYRSKLQTLKNWPARLVDWFVDNDYFKKPIEPVKKF
ncbi:alpha/beta hydrolase [Mucilaginibacter agri]|uniref:Alpha/beta hydrolase fold domain-containing protein n=1 Tax=Mucilaginibacter agri TaxID=2695265 RepID=A0A965ZFX6_9SPHI|nr:alpha/beta hydrolase [Mucilaginibacter agri]NCD69062.1 alpha/beta hydrolase fold domain-containing protein [Mucilaginibacter agri]